MRLKNPPALTDAYLKVKRPGTLRFATHTFKPTQVIIDVDERGNLAGIEFVGVPEELRQLLETLRVSTDTRRL